MQSISKTLFEELGFIMRIQLLVIISILLISCGSDEQSACSSETTLVISTSWDMGGTIDTTVTGQVNVPLVATPVITGVPDTCLGLETFSVGVSSGLPGGLELNTNTGVISGTPTQATGIGANGLVRMHLPGYNPISILAIMNIFQ